MNTENFFCKNYTNLKQIHHIINQAHQEFSVFNGLIKNRQTTLPVLTMTNLSNDHLFFSCDFEPHIYLSAGSELILSFHIQLEDTVLPCECTVTVVTFTQKENKLFIVTMFPYSISLMQRREQVRYPIKEEDFIFYSLFFTNTQVINEKDWQPINNKAITYHEISTGGLSLEIDTANMVTVPTTRSVLILKCKFPPQQLQQDPQLIQIPTFNSAQKELSNFILIAKIFRLSKKGSSILLRAKFTHWTYNTSNRKWNIVPAHTGITQIHPYILP